MNPQFDLVFKLVEVFRVADEEMSKRKLRGWNTARCVIRQVIVNFPGKHPYP